MTSIAGAAAGASIVSFGGYGIASDGSPNAGLEVYYSAGNSAAATVTYGSALGNTVTWVKANGSPISLISQTAGKHCTIALVNAQTGLTVASGDTTLVVGT